VESSDHPAEAAIADLKSHIDKLQDSIHFVEANAYRNGVEYNKIQAQKQQEVQRLQGQLAEQQKNLEKMAGNRAQGKALAARLGSIGSNGFRGCRSGTHDHAGVIC